MVARTDEDNTPLTAHPLPPRGPGDGEIFGKIALSLEQTGYALVPAALPPETLDRLLLDRARLSSADYRRAGVGRREDFQRNRFVRSDHICWLDGRDSGEAGFLDWMERLRRALNRRLFLGLFDYEAHHARYPAGAFYKKHVDAFRGRSNRVLSTVFYLNSQWQPSDGGELVLYAEDGITELKRVRPECGKLVVFLSEVFPHEVLPARRERRSIAGWFRVNTSSGWVPDPAH